MPDQTFTENTSCVSYQEVFPKHINGCYIDLKVPAVAKFASFLNTIDTANVMLCDSKLSCALYSSYKFVVLVVIHPVYTQY